MGEVRRTSPIVLEEKPEAGRQRRPARALLVARGTAFRQRKSCGDEPDEGREPGERDEEGYGVSHGQEDVETAHHPYDRNQEARPDDPFGQEFHGAGHDGNTSHKQSHRQGEARPAEGVLQVVERQCERSVLRDAGPGHRPQDVRGSGYVKRRHEATQERDVRPGGRRTKPAQVASDAYSKDAERDAGPELEEGRGANQVGMPLEKRHDGRCRRIRRRKGRP